MPRTPPKCVELLPNDAEGKAAPPRERYQPSPLDMHPGGTLFVDRYNGAPGHHYVPRAGVSVTGLLQSRVLAAVLKPDGPSAGLAGLFLLAMPPQVPQPWTEEVLGPGAENAYNGILTSLLALEFETVNGDNQPQVLSLAPEAKAARVAFHDARARERADNGGQVSAAFARPEGYADRLALVHHVVSRVSRRESDLVPVGRESVEAGLTPCRSFEAEARRIHALLFESAEEHRARCLAEYIRERGGRATVRVLMRGTTAAIPTPPPPRTPSPPSSSRASPAGLRKPAKLAVERTEIWIPCVTCDRCDSKVVERRHPLPRPRDELYSTRDGRMS